MRAAGTQAPTVTVILPTFNRAAMLPTAIESILSQTYRDFELIVVDDGSTDDTRAAVAAIEDPRLRYSAQQHTGVAAAMNRGLALAGGAFIARLDSDDESFPEFLATQLAALEAHPSAGLAYARGEVVDGEGRPTGETWGARLRYPGETLRSMVWGDAVCNITVLARRECFEQAGGYDESLATSEDWDMWLRIARHWDFVFVDRVLARIHRHSGNLTSATAPDWKAQLERREKVLDKAFASKDLPPEILGMRGIAYSNVHTANALHLLDERQYRGALHAAVRAVRVSSNRLWTLARLLWFALKTRAPRSLPDRLGPG